MENDLACKKKIQLFSPKRLKEIQNTYNSYLIVEMNNITYSDLKFTDRFIIGEYSLVGEIGQN